MLKVEWERYRRSDGSIDLCAIFEETPQLHRNSSREKYDRAVLFLNNVEIMQRIVSRQVAAIALATAFNIANP